MHSSQNSAVSRPLGALAFRPAVYSIAKVLYLLFTQLTTTRAAPLEYIQIFSDIKPKVDDAQHGEFWAYIGIAIALVVLGGAFAGLTIA